MLERVQKYFASVAFAGLLIPMPFGIPIGKINEPGYWLPQLKQPAIQLCTSFTTANKKTCECDYNFVSTHYSFSKANNILNKYLAKKGLPSELQSAINACWNTYQH